MRTVSVARLALGRASLRGLLSPAASDRGSNSAGSFASEIPRTWDDQALATLEVPIANPVGSPQHASADCDFRIPRPCGRERQHAGGDHESKSLN